MELIEARRIVDGAIAAELAGDDGGRTMGLSELAGASVGVSLEVAAALSGGTVTERRVGAFLLRQVWENQRPLGSVELSRALLSEEDEPAVIAPLLWNVGSSGLPERLHDVLKYLDHPSELVRYAVSDSISSFTPDGRARDALMRLAGDSDQDVRWSAVFELGAWLYDSGDPNITELLTLIAALATSESCSRTRQMG